MKHLLILILLALSPSVCAFGGESTPNKVKLKLSTKPNHHQTPSIVVIDCEYFDDVMSFVFPDHVEWADVDIKDDAGMSVVYDVVYADDPMLEIPLVQGTYEITCRTDGNQIFSGVIYIQ